AEDARVLGAVAPSQRASLPVSGLLGPTLADPKRARNRAVGGGVLADFFGPAGVSRVAGRAVLLPATGGGIDVKARNAAAAGASLLLVFGSNVAAGALDLDETAGLPVLAVREEGGRRALEALARGERVSVSIQPAARVPNVTAGQVAPFSSGGLAFGGQVKPEIVAPGISIATADAGRNGDGSARYGTATGSSAAAAIAAGAAAAVAQARPGLTASELKSILVGSAEQLVRDGVPEPVTVQGAGMLDAAAAGASELAVEPTTLAFGRVSDSGWQVVQALKIRNLSIRPLTIGFEVARDSARGPKLAFAAEPAGLPLAPGESGRVILSASAGQATGSAGGAFLVLPHGSRAVRVPWAVSFRGKETQPLVSGVALSERAFVPSDTSPTVLAFRAGRVEAGRDGYAVEAVAHLVAELWTGDGSRMGVLARIRDLLPGRYALGLTGRGPKGKTLEPGDYFVRLRAEPVPGDFGAAVSAVDIPFTIRGERRKEVP
ncbi:MAG: S8 family serine peptidase, partial [Actinomycetota bacterium]|nr:S8 family serine peptidase [Actinomycetota bacterium]